MTSFVLHIYVHIDYEFSVKSSVIHSPIFVGKTHLNSNACFSRQIDIRWKGFRGYGGCLILFR